MAVLAVLLAACSSADPLALQETRITPTQQPTRVQLHSLDVAILGPTLAAELATAAALTALAERPASTLPAAETQTTTAVAVPSSTPTPTATLTPTHVPILTSTPAPAPPIALRLPGAAPLAQPTLRATRSPAMLLPTPTQRPQRNSPVTPPSATGGAAPPLVPTRTPSPQPTDTSQPTRTPKQLPTRTPSPQPTRTPTLQPTRASLPTRTPSPQPTRTPKLLPTPSATRSATPKPTAARTPSPLPTTAGPVGP